MSTPKIVAHRGMRFRAPENSPLAINAAIEAGVPGVEFDIAITSDGVPVGIHEETLDLAPDLKRFIAASAVPERNNIATLDWDTVKRIDAGSWFGQKYSGMALATLSEIFSLEWRDTSAFIELKEPYYWQQRNPAFEQRLIESVSEDIHRFLHTGGSVVLLSYNEYLLQRSGEAMPGVPRQWNIWLEWEQRRDEVISIATRSGFQSVGMPERFLMDDIRWRIDLHAAGVHCGTYSSSLQSCQWPLEPGKLPPEVYWRELCDRQPDAVIVDYPLELCTLLRQNL